MTRRGLLALLLLAACDSDPVSVTSADLSSGEIELSLELRSNGELAQILVTALRAEDGYPLALTGGDQLLFGPAGDPFQQLVPIEGSYIGQVTTNAVDFELVFARGTTRLTSQPSLPPGFTLSVPAGPVSRADPIPIAWDPAEGPFGLLLEVDSPCLDYRILRSFEQDVGSFAIQPADLAVTPGTSDCDLQVMMTRSGTTSELSPELSPESRGIVEQIRTVTIATVP